MNRFLRTQLQMSDDAPSADAENGKFKQKHLDHQSLEIDEDDDDERDLNRKELILLEKE